MSINLYVGSMFAGKSSYLIEQLNRFHSLGKKTLRVIPTISQRDFETHNLCDKNLNKGITTIATDSLKKINFDGYAIIGIDEIQFFDDSDHISKITGFEKMIICGLDGTSEQEEFRNTSKIYHHCDKIKKLHSKCKVCLEHGILKSASFTKSLFTKKSTIDIGGSEKYYAVCREHLSSAV